MERIMNEENDWDHDVEGDALEGPVVCVSNEEVLPALSEMITGKAPGPSEVLLQFIAASRGVGLQVMDEICQKYGYGIPVEWDLSTVVPVFVGKGGSRNCSCSRDVKLLEYGQTVVEMVFEKRLHRIVYVDKMQFGFMPER